jgi:DNA-binding CsgD family transcriptional regulator
MVCTQGTQSATVPSIWNPLPGFADVKADGQTGNVQTVDHFLTAAQDGTLPAVSWVVPNGKVSEHPPALVSDGQSYVTSLIDAVMQGPDWASTAIFLAWDDWGGFYDHASGDDADVSDDLTAREREILPFIAAGKTNKEIAAAVFRAEKTVKNYVSSILAKLGLDRRTQVPAFVAEHETRRPEQ